MRLAPGGDIVVVVALRDRAAHDQEQNLRQRMEDPPDITQSSIVERCSRSTDRRDFSDRAARTGDMA